MNDFVRKMLVTRLLGPKSAAPKWWLAGGLIDSGSVVAAWQSIGAASLAASYVNVANPGTYDLSLGVAPTWSAATGWTFNGTTQFLNTGITPGSGTTLIVRYSGAPNFDYVAGMFGSLAPAVYYTLVPLYTGTQRYRWAEGTNFVAGGNTDGTLALAGPNCYVDGAPDGTISGTWNPTRAVSVYIGGVNQYGVGLGSDSFGGSIQAAAMYSTILTAPQIAALHTDMMALS